MTKRTTILYFAVILISVCFIFVGYAILSDTLGVRVAATVEPPVYDTIVITDIVAMDGTTATSETHTRVIPTNVKSVISATAGQTVVYRITAHNYSETETYIYNGIRSFEAFDETLEKLTVSVSSDQNGTESLSTTPKTQYVNGTAIEPGDDFTFYVTYTITSDIKSEELLINYVFDPIIYTITYIDDNDIWAVDHIINNQEVYYVKTEGPTNPDTQNRVFLNWVNANAAPVQSYPAGNTNSYTLSAKWDKMYLIMFVDKDGNVLYEEIFYDSSTSLSASGQAEVDAILAGLRADAAKDDMSVSWSDYNIKNAKSDIVVRPIFTYTGILKFTPVDRDGDGIIDYYKVDAVAKLKDPVKIPGTHQGLPVETVEKLYKNDDNFDYGAGIKTIEIGEGVKRLEHNALSHTADLKTVYLPNSMEHIGKNAFSRNWGKDKKEITIYYNGTMAEWKKLVSNSHEDWDNGITTSSGSKVMCSDGYFEYDYGFIGIGAKWKEYKY